MQAPVWKMIYLARRNPALPAEGFAQAWREHSALGRQCRNVGQRVQAVAQCARVLQAQAPALSQMHDGVNLMVLADRASGALIWNDPETLQIMRPDEPRVFADYVRNFSMLCSEHVLHPCAAPAERPANGQVILVGLLQRQPQWHGPASAPQSLPESWCAGALGQARRIVCNTVDEAGPPQHEFRFIVEWWFDDVAQAQSAALALDQEGSGDAYSWGDAVFLLAQVTHSRS